MMYSRLRGRKILLNLSRVILITAMTTSSAAKGETPLDLERLQYCELSSKSATAFAKIFYQEGSYGVTWSDYSRLNKAWSHFLLLMEFNQFPYADHDETMLMYDLLVRKFGRKGALDFLKMRVSECLSDFPTASVD